MLQHFAKYDILVFWQGDRNSKSSDLKQDRNL